MGEREANIRLSCLITNYNQIEWIEEAVESILKQNLEYEYEVLVGDDGSNDGSLELLQTKYGNNPRVRLLVQDRDRSIKEFSDWRHSRLIFRLLDEAKGDYVSFLDGDDYFCNMDHFQRKIELLDKPENRDCVACYGNMYKLVDGELELYTCVPYERGKYEWLKDKIYVHLATGVIRKNILEDVPRDIYYEQFVDWEITTWVAHKGLIYYDPEPCFVYRILPNSIYHGASIYLNSLRQVIICDSNYQAYGGKRIDEFRSRRNVALRLYHSKSLAEDIDYEMWNAFTEKYHAKVANMLLNRSKLKISEKLWLAFFCFRLEAPWKKMSKKLLGYCIGIGQLCNPKVPLREKGKLLENWFANNIRK